MDKEIRAIGWILIDKHNKNIVIHRRDANAPVCPNMWDNFGGGFEEHVDKTEIDTLKREINEELNIIIDTNEIHELRRKDLKVVYWIDFSFNKFCQINLGEGAGLAWITLDGALSLNDLTSEARRDLELLRSIM